MSVEELREMAFLATESLYYSVDLYKYENQVSFTEAEKEEITFFYIQMKFIEQITQGVKEGTLKLFEYIYNYG